MSELLELCESGDLSLDALQEIINFLGPHGRVLLQNQLCFHEACYNKNVTLEIVQLLYNTLPGAFLLRADDGSLPIHELCCNGDLDDNNSLDILRFMLEVDPNLSREVVYGNRFHFIMLLIINQLPSAKNLLMHTPNHYGSNQMMVGCQSTMHVPMAIEMMQLIQFNACWSWILN